MNLQLLDGIGAGIFGVLWVTVVADLTKGTGRYNLTLGAVSTAQSIGAALGNMVDGYVVHAWGYHWGLLLLASIAACALVIFFWAMPETKDPETSALLAPIRSSLEQCDGWGVRFHFWVEETL